LIYISCLICALRIHAIVFTWFQKKTKAYRRPGDAAHVDMLISTPAGNVVLVSAAGCHASGYHAYSEYMTDFGPPKYLSFRGFCGWARSSGTAAA
jgi:hypothetical protein